MKQQILQYLNLSLVPDSNTIKQATTKLSKLARQSNYCMIMMEIGDDRNQNIAIRQAALVQFKNAVRKYWGVKEFQICLDEKKAILDALVQAFLRAASTNPLLKLYKQIISIITEFAQKSWLPIQKIRLQLQNNPNPVPTLHLIIGIESSFQISMHDKERQAFYSFLKFVLPLLLNLVQRNCNQEVIYLVMKILWKVVKNQVEDQIRELLCNWMDLVLSVAGASNSQLQANICEIQNKGTVEFFYFHAKKWATRILYRFICRHANPTSNMLATEVAKQHNKQFSMKWYEAYGARVVEVIVKQFLVPSITKTRFFQLKCLTGLINHHSQQMKQYSEFFQYHILPTFLQLQPEDEQLANSNPIKFINREQQLSTSYTYLKRQAKEAWIAFTNIGAKKKKKKKGRAEQVGVLFNQNMNYIKSKLDGSNLLEKQMAMYLICQLRSSIKNCDQMKKILPNLISQYVIPEFTSGIMFLRARSMEIFNGYGDLDFDKSILKKTVEGIYFCLSEDKYPLVRLKAASAFHVLLEHEDARELVKPLFKQILQIYLFLLQQYDSQALVYSLSRIIKHFSIQVGPYACELMKYLAKYFITLMEKDEAQSSDPEYDGETQFAASEVLNTMRILIQSGVDKENIVKMESDIVQVCDEVFSGNIDNIEDVFTLLHAYTHKMPTITERILFYYVALIYYVSGIKQSLWSSIPQLPIPDTQKRILNSLKSGYDIDSIDQVMFVLRNYIVLDSEILMKVTDPFGVNLLQLLLDMVSHIYEKGPSQYDGEVKMSSSTLLMGYLLESNHRKWDDNILNHIWQVVKLNLTRAQSKLLKAINAQLVCLFLWNNPQKILALAQNDNLLSQMIICILNSQQKIKKEHERQRLILGISQLISQPNKPHQLIQHLPKLFNFVITLVKKNCEYHLNGDDDQNNSIESQQQQQQLNLNGLNLTDEQPEEIWQQDFQNSYSSKLNKIDEIKYFKESMQKLQNQQNMLYGQLIALVPVHQLEQLDQNIGKAIQLRAQSGNK